MLAYVWELEIPGFSLPVIYLNLQRAQSLTKEVQEVKATLQAMLAQLKEEEEEEEEEEEVKEERHRTAMHDCVLMENGTEDEEDEDEEGEKEDEEEEDQYFSDSWDI